MVPIFQTLRFTLLLTIFLDRSLESRIFPKSFPSQLPPNPLEPFPRTAIVTLPIVVPMMKKMGVDLIWFGIVIVMLVELAQLHPPVGMNLFIVRNISKGKIEDVIIGSAPFLIAIVAALLLVTLFPSIVVFLPRLIKY